MRVLAIDTALEACSVALLDTAQPDRAVHESQPMARGHAEALMPMIARVFDRAGFDANAIDRVAVTVGPGSFTGLRVGIAAAPWMKDLWTVSNTVSGAGGAAWPRVPCHGGAQARKGLNFKCDAVS